MDKESGVLEASHERKSSGPRSKAQQKKVNREQNLTDTGAKAYLIKGNKILHERNKKQKAAAYLV